MPLSKVLNCSLDSRVPLTGPARGEQIAHRPFNLRRIYELSLADESCSMCQRLFQIMRKISDAIQISGVGRGHDDNLI
jgi:hypothetical protein